MEPPHGARTGASSPAPVARLVGPSTGAAAFALACILTSRASAQTPDAPTDTRSASSLTLPEPVLLTRGTPAPFTGQLILQVDLLRWAMRIEDLEHRLDLDVRTERERCDVRLELERARTTAADERASLRDGLYRERVEELAASLEAARRSSERQWYESPVLWFAAGAVVAVGAALGLAAAF